MPSGADSLIAIRIMDWAYEDPEPLRVAPGPTREFRSYVETPLGRDESRWRHAYDLALVVWQICYDRRLKVLEVMEDLL